MSQFEIEIEFQIHIIISKVKIVKGQLTLDEVWLLVYDELLFL